MLRLLATPLAALAFLSTCITATAQVTPPAGWTQRSTPQGEEMTPTAAPNVSILIHPPESLAGSDLSAWFSRRANEETQRAGQSLNQSRINRNSAQSFSMYTHVRGADGQQFILFYSCVERSDGTAQLIATRIPDSEKDTMSYVRAAGNVTGQLAKAQAPSPAPQATAETHTPAPPTNEPTNNPAPQPPTPAANGMTVVALLHEGRGMSTVTGFKYVEQVDALFGDGTAYEELQTPPEVLNVAQSRQAEPSKWHHWRRQGTTYVWDKGGAWAKIDGDIARPLEQGTQLNRRLITRSSYSFGMAGGSVFTDTYNFSSNGSFNRGNTAQHGSGSMQASAGAGASSYHVQDRYGSRTSTGTYGGGGTIATAQNSNQPGKGAGAMYGTYTVHGYTLELHTAAGSTQQLLVCYPFPNSNKVYINGATYDNN